VQGFSIDRFRGRFVLFGLDDWRSRDLHHVPPPVPPRSEPKREQHALPALLIHDSTLLVFYEPGEQADVVGVGEL
jgi:hypothetical protein